MNIKLNFNEQFNSIDVIYPINNSDRLDGLQDTISCEFYLNDDLLPYYHKHQKIIIDILDDEDNILKQYRMCITDLNRELCSTYDKNSAYTYRYTLTACEPTVLINENIRTDIAITPYAYGDDTPYKTLYDAYYKVCSCHNLNNRNEPIYNLYKRWELNEGNNYIDATHTNSSNYNFWLTGTLLGGYKTKSYYYHQTGEHIEITATLPTYTWNDEIVTFPVEKEAEIEVTTERWNDLDPSIIETTQHTYTLNFILNINENSKLYYNITKSGINDDDFLWDFNSLVEYKDKKSSIYSYLSSVPCPSLTYKDLSTYSQLEDIFSRVGLIPYLDYDLVDKYIEEEDKYIKVPDKSYVTFYLIQGQFDNNTIDILSSEETAKLNDYTSNSTTAQIKNISCDTETITFPSKYTELLKRYNYGVDSEGNDINIPITFDGTFSEEEVGLYTSNNNVFRAINMLVPNTYDSSSEAIQDSNQYYLELPTNIEDIKYMFYINPPSNSTDTSTTLTKIDTSKIIEYSLWKNLPASQQKLYAYFIRGENVIRQSVALLASVGQLSGDWAWSSTKCYNALRKARFICVYKPMIDVSYTYYRYNNLEDTTTKNIDLPYKAISDKQISNTLAYEYEKQTSNKISYKLVTRDINEVINHYAGERVYYRNRKFNETDLIKNGQSEYFATFEDLQNNLYRSVAMNIKFGEYTKNSYAKVGSENNFQYYVINSENYSWEKYIGFPCVITKMDVVINKNSIEISYELNTNISQNSVVTGYSDNVRVSDNLSTETEVTREINLYKSFLLNCTAQKLNLNNGTFQSIDFPSVALPDNEYLNLHNKNVFLLNGIDNLILPMGMAQMGCFTTTNANYLNDVSKINKLGLVFDACYDNIGFVGNYENVVAHRKKERITNNTSAEEYLLIIGNGTVANSEYNIKLKFENNKYILTNIWTETDDNVSAVTRAFIPNYLVQLSNEDRELMLNNKMYFYYTKDSNGYIRMVKNYVTNPEAKWYNWHWAKETLLDTWSSSASSYPTYYTLCDFSENLGTTYPANNNPIFVSSNNISKLSFVNTNPATIGNYVDGFNENGQWTKSQPLFYKQSKNKSSILAINGKGCNYSNFPSPYNYEDLPMYNFSTIIEKYGFTDLYIDIREKINVNIQYIVTQNDTNKFYCDNSDWLYAQWSVNSLYCPRSRTIANIKELNTNIDWMCNYSDKELSNYKTGNIIFKRLPKNISMSEFIKNNSNYQPYCTATGELVEDRWRDDLFGMQRVYNLNITANASLTDNSDEYNYALINVKEDGEEIPLMIIDTQGCEFPENKINISYFLI